MGSGRRVHVLEQIARPLDGAYVRGRYGSLAEVRCRKVQGVEAQHAGGGSGAAFGDDVVWHGHAGNLWEHLRAQHCVAAHTFLIPILQRKLWARDIRNALGYENEKACRLALCELSEFQCFLYCYLILPAQYAAVLCRFLLLMMAA